MKKDNGFQFSTEEGSDFSIGVDMGLDVMNLIMKHIQARSIENEPVVSIGVLVAIFGCLYDMIEDQDLSEDENFEPVDKLIEIAQTIAKSSNTVEGVTIN